MHNQLELQPQPLASPGVPPQVSKLWCFSHVLGVSGRTGPQLPHPLSILPSAVCCSHVLWASPRPFLARSVNSSLASLTQVTESTHTAHFRCLPGAELELVAGVPRPQCCRCLQLCSAFLLETCPSPLSSRDASPLHGMPLPCMACIPRLPTVGHLPLQDGTDRQPAPLRDEDQGEAACRGGDQSVG